MAAEQVPGYRALAPRYRNALPSNTTRDRISRYLAHMTPGGVLTSNFMAMCDVAASDGVRSIKCRACKGLGSKDGDPKKVALWEEQLRKPEVTWMRARELRAKISRERECFRCGGTGYREKNLKREQADRIFNTVRCAKCLGSGEVVNEDAEDVCPRCLSDGCVVPQTVRETGSSKHGWMPPGATSFTDDAAAAWLPPAEPDEEQADEFAQTAQVLAELELADATAAEAAALYHGPLGDKWASHPWKRAFVLWPMTDGGRGLSALYIERPELRGAGHLVLPLDRIAIEREQESHATAPDMLRRTLISKAAAEARILEARMLSAIADAEASVG